MHSLSQCCMELTKALIEDLFVLFEPVSVALACQNRQLYTSHISLGKVLWSFIVLILLYELEAA